MSIADKRRRTTGLVVAVIVIGAAMLYSSLSTWGGASGFARRSSVDDWVTERVQLLPRAGWILRQEVDDAAVAIARVPSEIVEQWTRDVDGFVDAGAPHRQPDRRFLQFPDAEVTPYLEREFSSNAYAVFAESRTFAMYYDPDTTIAIVVLSEPVSAR